MKKIKNNKRLKSRRIYKLKYRSGCIYNGKQILGKGFYWSVSGSDTIYVTTIPKSEGQAVSYSGISSLAKSAINEEDRRG